MVLYTHIARCPDALPLAASVVEDEHAAALKAQRAQLSAIVNKISAQSEPRASIESGDYTIHYLLVDNIVYMCIADKSYPRKLVFSYLEEVQKEFSKSYNDEARRPGLRPYAFVQFDGFMQKTTRLYQDARASQNLDKLNAELQDVTKVMTKNIEDLLYRGDSLDRMSDLSSNLRMESKKYRRVARKVNLEAMLRQNAPIIVVVALLLLFIWWKFM